MTELLAPAGNAEKLKTALYFGADAVYMAAKEFGLRAFTDNFTFDALASAVRLVHEKGKRAYVACNIFAHDEDLSRLDDYIAALTMVNPDGVIVSDLGIFTRFRKKAPQIPIHISTQANTTNGYAAAAWAELGAKRIVLARELSLKEIAHVRKLLPDTVELEAFVHGAMCISYSGRCLLSDYMTGRHSNAGECAQSCRWEYTLLEKTRNQTFDIEEDPRGSYILNSRDMNMLAHLSDLAEAGVSCFKIEGRVKTTYYVACIVNAYRRALNALTQGITLSKEILEEPFKSSHRAYCTGFYYGFPGQDSQTAKPERGYDFSAVVTEAVKDGIIVEMRSRFKTGDVLEVLSPGPSFNKRLRISHMEDLAGEPVADAYKVQQKIKIYTDLPLAPMDILRKRL